MRITGGEKRGFKLKAPPGTRTRPPTEKIRIAVFNILGSAIQGARVLDLFAGSGSFGIEALSRGAASVDFVDSSGFALKHILANLRHAGLDERSNTIRARAWDYVRSNIARLDPYDIIFLDPPFKTAGKVMPGDDVFEMVSDLALGCLVVAGGKVLLRVPSEAEVAEKWPSFKVLISRNYGVSRLLLFEAEPEGDAQLG